MGSFVVMLPPARPGDAMLVRDGFHFFAFLVPFAWLFWHRLWIEAALALVAAMALGILGSQAGFTLTGPLLCLLVSIYVGLEGAALKVAGFTRRGWRQWGVVEAANRDDAEVRYIAEAYGDEAPDDRGPWGAPQSSEHAPERDAGPALGLFSYPGRG